MLFIRFLLIAVGVGLFGAASGVVAYDIYIAAQLRRLLGRRKSRDGGTEAGEKLLRPLSPARWRPARQMSRLGIAPFLLGSSIVGAFVAFAGARVSQISGTRPGTLYHGARQVVPLVGNAVIYDLCEHAFTSRKNPGKAPPAARPSKTGREVLKSSASQNPAGGPLGRSKAMKETAASGIRFESRVSRPASGLC